MHYGGSTGFSQSGFLMQFHVSMIQSESPMDASSACDILNGVIVILKSAWQNNCCFLGHLLFLLDIVIARWAIVPLCMISSSVCICHYLNTNTPIWKNKRFTRPPRNSGGVRFDKFPWIGRISKQCLVKQFQRHTQWKDRSRRVLMNQALVG